MRTVILAAAAMNLAAAVNPISALAAEAGPGNRYAMSQTADKLPSNASMSPHYQWRYHYDRNGRYKGEWELVR